MSASAASLIVSGSPAFVRALAAVAKERERQVSVEDYSPEHDDEHKRGELALAGASYAVLGGLGFEPETEEMRAWFARVWPWWKYDQKPKRKGWERDLARAAALILAEMERRYRAAEREGSR